MAETETFVEHDLFSVGLWVEWSLSQQDRVLLRGNSHDSCEYYGLPFAVATATKDVVPRRMEGSILARSEQVLILL